MHRLLRGALVLKYGVPGIGFDPVRASIYEFMAPHSPPGSPGLLTRLTSQEDRHK